MASFTRQGTFKDRNRFIEGFKASVSKFVGSGAPGMTESWEKSGGSDVGRLSGFGMRVELTVGPESWTCEAEIPSWLPIPVKTIEEKLDKKLGELSVL